MSRLTITLSEPRYRALKEAAAQRGKTIGQLIDESLDFYGIKSNEQALDLVRRARARNALNRARRSRWRKRRCRPHAMPYEQCVLHHRHQCCRCRTADFAHADSPWPAFWKACWARVSVRAVRGVVGRIPRRAGAAQVVQAAWLVGGGESTLFWWILPGMPSCWPRS